MEIIIPKATHKATKRKRLCTPPYRVGILGVFKDENCSNVYFSKAFRGFPEVASVSNFNYRESLKRAGNKFPREFSSFASNVDLVVICKGSGIPTQIIKKISSYRSTFLWFMDWFPQIEWNKSVGQYSKFCHYRSATGYETALLWSNKISLPTYHIVDGSDPDIFYSEGVPEQYKRMDVSFIGGSDTERDQIKNFLLNEGIDVHFFGPGYTSFVDVHHFRRICSRSKIMLNISRGKYEGYSSLRLWNMLACNSFVLTKKIPKMKKYLGLQDEKHIDSFDNLLELKRKIKFYLDNPQIRNKISNNAHHYTINNRTWKHSVGELLSIVNNEQPYYVKV